MRRGSGGTIIIWRKIGWRALWAGTTRTTLAERKLHRVSRHPRPTCAVSFSAVCENIAYNEMPAEQNSRRCCVAPDAIVKTDARWHHFHPQGNARKPSSISPAPPSCAARPLPPSPRWREPVPLPPAAGPPAPRVPLLLGESGAACCLQAKREPTVTMCFWCCCPSGFCRYFVPLNSHHL